MAVGDKSVKIGQVTALTVITPIDPARLERLKQVLHTLQVNPDSPIKKISTIHFARWVIIDDGARLLFTSNFDGEWEQYLRDFVTNAPAGLDAIWSNCVGYPGAADFDAFRAYVDAHEIRTDLFYAAYPDITVKQVLKSAKVQKLALDLLDELS